MNRYVSRVRRPVQRSGAENYLLITLLSFAASVALTRLFLMVTGYPQIGGGGLHIAHVLWGGLLLFIAAMLPLILANRWVYRLSAILSGVGVGLFIDEVGKFITQNNNYFFPAAAPIIYVFFLLTVLLYLQVRRPSPKEPRNELYHALDEFEEVLDRDLDEQEQTALMYRLRWITAHTESPDLARLSQTLLEYLEHQDLQLAPRLPGILEQIRQSLIRIQQKVTPTILRGMLIGGLSGLGLVSCIRIIQMSSAHYVPVISSNSLVASPWFIARLILEGFVMLLLLGAAVLLFLGHIHIGLSLSYYGLILSLTVTNLLVFYFDQFLAIIPASIQFVLLLGVIYYRKKFLYG
jgi:hypothetical protein